MRPSRYACSISATDLRSAARLAPGTHTIVSNYTRDFVQAAILNDDWYHAVGTHGYWAEAEVCATPGWVQMYFKWHFQDYYDFNGTPLERLHKVCSAQDYETIGTASTGIRVTK